MSFAIEEIASQPSCWRRAVELAADSPPGLPEPGERLGVIGCGTSLFMAQAYAALRERSGLGESDAFPASEFPVGRRYDRVLALTRSGTTTEVLAALDRMPRGVATAAITADPHAPVVSAAQQVLILDFADERSVVQTRFATTSLVLLRAQLGEPLADLPGQGERALSAELPDDPAAFRRYTFLGAGWTAGIASEAGLKLRESAQAWTEAYPAMEYRHGPIAVTDSSSLVWFFGEPPSGLEEEVKQTGATIVRSALDPLADLIRAQRMAIQVAESRGLDPDHPRHLTRSVVLRPGDEQPTSLVS
jgi:fructoselysine-6-P-deglycase FrlB-like protein